MGQCSKRFFLLSLCVIQLLTTLERQVFDFLGFMWAPILANFLNILFIIFGFFGTFQYVSKYIYSYAAWNLLWLAWNIFVICFYLNIGVLNRESGILSLGTGSISWWEINGWGCHAQWDGEAAPWLRPPRVEGCLFHYSHVESAHAAVQCLLAVIAIIFGFYHAATLAKCDDNRSRTSVKSSGQSLYSIEFSRPAEIRIEPPTKPMTPRRVKRRSVSSRHSTRHSSRRTSQRRSHQNNTAGHSNPTYRQSSQQSLNDSYNDEELYNHNRPASVRSSYSNFHGARPISLHADNSTLYPESSYNDTYLSRPGSSPTLSTEATPQVPQKRSVPDPALMSLPYRVHSSQSAFLSNGPPAYHLHQGSQYFPPPPDSETAM